MYSDFRLEWLREKSGVTQDTRGITNTGVAEKLKKVKVVSQNTLTHASKLSSLYITHKARVYLKSRMIPDDKLDELFYTEDFSKIAEQINPQMVLQKEERIVIPFYDENKNLIGVQGRALSGNGLRYITVKTEGQDRLFYNIHKVDVNKRIYVTEGPFDSMFLPNAVAMVGASKSVNLPDKLHMCDVVFCLDNEPRSSEIVNMMRNLIAKEHQVFIPDRLEHKDINEMILSGKTSENIVEYIDDHTYGGILAQAALTQWSCV